ncbi:MAG: hypothetical protein PWP07_2622 [Epulopiscium sp.]|nr:hypothetical protein [Candidatus Epulonipiscium sp.]
MAEYNNKNSKNLEDDLLEAIEQQFNSGEPLMKEGELPLLVFISSVISELKKEREEVLKIFRTYPSVSPMFYPWVFEYTPGSSWPLDYSYLSKVREADIVIWLVGAETTEPVRNEIREAIASNRRLLVVLLPVRERTQATQELLKEVGPYAKWVEVEKAGSLERAIKLSLEDEIKRALKGIPEIGYHNKMMELYKQSIGRCIARWQAVGVPKAIAYQLALDPSFGLPDQVSQRYIESFGVLILIGELGAGKSLIMERLYQRAIFTARDNINAPIPVYLRASEVSEKGLEELVKKETKGLGTPHIQGVELFIDGVDEIGTAFAFRLLDEARVLANTWPNSRITLACRPIPGFKEMEEAIQVPLLTEGDAYELIGKLTGGPVTAGMAFGWPKSIREAIRLPLFAILLSTYLRTQNMKAPKSKGELLSYLVEKALEQGRIDIKHVANVLYRLAVLSIDRNGSPVPASEVASKAEIEPLLQSGLVVEHEDTLSFPLPVLAQWFAARSLAEGFLEVTDLLSDPQRLDAWHYPLVIFVATSNHEQVTNILEPLVKVDPGFVSAIISEGLASWGLVEEILPPSPQKCGQRIRAAMKAWVEGIGPLARLIAPVNGDGTLLPIGVRTDGAWLSAGWYNGPEKVPDVVLLPYSELSSNLEVALRWPSVRSVRPGRQSAWPWRWTLEELSSKLAELLQNQILPVGDGPLMKEYVWITALKVTGRGSLEDRPIPLFEIENFLSTFPDDIFIDSMGRKWSLVPLKKEINRLRDTGETELCPPWPGPDRELRSGWIWEGYSNERMLARAKAIYEGALEGYQQLVKIWFSKFAKRLPTWTVLPARLVGIIVPGDRKEGFVGGPTISWYLEPLPYGRQSYIDLTLGTKEIESKEFSFEQLVTKFRKLRPEIATRHIIHHEILDIFHIGSATRLAYDWLWDDLRWISWVSGMRGRRVWE